MKVRFALALAGLLLITGLAVVPNWNKASAQDASWDIQDLSAVPVELAAEIAKNPGDSKAQALPASGWGHWLNGPRKCQIEPWNAPDGLIPCKTINIGARRYHIAGVSGRTIYVD